MLWGDVPSIKSVGIITAFNPQSLPASKKENETKNNELKKELMRANYGPISAKGQHGLKEDTFLIPNISKEFLIDLGEKYDQESIIWGEKKIDKNENPYFEFQFILVASGATTSTRSVHLGGKEVQDRPDLYTMIKGRKFVIPFFDDEMRHMVPGEKYGTVKLSPEEDPDVAARRVELETFLIPFFDDLSEELIFWGLANEISYYSDKLPDDPYAKELIERVHLCESKLEEEGKIPRFYWEYRGVIRESLRYLESL